VHSIALGLFEDKEKIHWFRDVGYQHIPFFNCPRRPEGKCRGCKEGLFSVSDVMASFARHLRQITGRAGYDTTL
jgi:hypothetical protein